MARVVGVGNEPCIGSRGKTRGGTTTDLSDPARSRNCHLRRINSGRAQRVRGRGSMHVIEVRRGGEDVAGAMGRMRAWLDDHQIAPRLFRLDDDVFRLEFETETEAAAFADAFAGHLTSLSDTPAA